jgi:hypothetical protein
LVVERERDGRRAQLRASSARLIRLLAARHAADQGEAG